MPINKLSLSNFRLHTLSSLSFSPFLTLVTGPNGNGKSSIPDAIELFFLGNNHYLDGRGSGSSHLIRLGAKEAELRIETDKGNWTRTIPTGEGVKALNNSIYEKFGNPAIIRACLSEGLFTRLPKEGGLKADDQKALLCEALGLNIPESTFIEQLKSYDKTQPLEALYIEAKASTMGRDELGWVSDEIASLNLHIKNLTREISLLENGHQENLYDENSYLESKRLVGELEKELALSDTLLIQYHRDSKILEALTTRLSTLREDAIEEAAAIDSLSLEYRPEILSELENEIDELESKLNFGWMDINSLDCSRGCVREALGEWKDRASGYSDRIRELKGRVITHEEANYEIVRRKKDLNEINSQIEACTKQIELIGELKEPPHPSETIKKLSKARAEFNLMEVQKAANDRLKADNSLRNEKSILLESHKTRLHQLSILKEALGPGGIKARLLGPKLLAFVEEVNKGLEGLAPKISIDLDPYQIWGLLGKGKVPIQMLSKSQRARISLVLQSSIARASGFGFVAWDPDAGFSDKTEALIGNYLAKEDGVQRLIITQRPQAWEALWNKVKGYKVVAGITECCDKFEDWIG